MADQQVVVRLENITKKYKDKIALDECNLSFEKGKIYGVIGPNGAGKTTMFGIMAGLIKQTKGKVEFFKGQYTDKDIRKRMSFLIELPYLDGEMTAYQNLKYVMLLSNLQDESKIIEVLKTVGLEQEEKKKVKTFSLGMRQRMGIAMALIKDPEVLVLDEPMNGLDPEGVVKMRNLLMNICEQRQVTIIISSHILGELDRLANEFIIVGNGKILDQIDKNMLEELKVKEGWDSLEDFYMKKVGQLNETVDESRII